MDIPIDKFDLFVGFFVLVGLIAVACLTAFLAGPDLFDIGSVEVKTYLPSTYGLKRGALVSYLKLTVGHVKSVALYQPEDPHLKVEVAFTIKRKYREVIKKNFQTRLEAETLGGIISGNIILSPPEQDTGPSGPVEDGDVLAYHKSASLLGDITNLSFQLQENVVPKIDSILTELNAFMQRLNDPDGKFRGTIELANNVAQTMADEENILMKTMRNEELLVTMNEIAKNLQTASQKSVAIAEEGQRVVDTAKQTSTITKETLDVIVPQIKEILNNILTLQADMAVILAETREITASVARVTDSLPAMASDAQAQLKEMEQVNHR
ncbi:MAG: MlaD family protein [Planctomycetota bacterium]|jgi:ABC-type transporter Mla subunit MlaD